MNGGKFPTYSYTFLMDFTSRKDSENNYRLAAKNTELFAGLTYTTCEADNKKYRWVPVN